MDNNSFERPLCVLFFFALLVKVFSFVMHIRVKDICLLGGMLPGSVLRFSVHALCPQSSPAACPSTQHSTVRTPLRPLRACHVAHSRTCAQTNHPGCLSTYPSPGEIQCRPRPTTILGSASLHYLQRQLRNHQRMETLLPALHHVLRPWKPCRTQALRIHAAPECHRCLCSQCANPARAGLWLLAEQGDSDANTVVPQTVWTQESIGNICHCVYLKSSTQITEQVRLEGRGQIHIWRRWESRGRLKEEKVGQRGGMGRNEGGGRRREGGRKEISIKRRC